MIHEGTNFKPNTPYAISRAAQDFNLIAYYKNFNFPIIITRAANILGLINKSRIVPKSIMSCLTNKKFQFM